MPAKQRSKRSSKKRSRRSSRKYGMIIAERIQDQREQRMDRQNISTINSRPVSSDDTDLKSVLSAVESKIKGLGIQILILNEHFFVRAYLITMFVFPLLKLIEKGTKIENIKELTNIDKLFKITETFKGNVDSLNELIIELDKKIPPFFNQALHVPIYARYLERNPDVVELDPVQLLKLEINTSVERLGKSFPVDFTDEVKTMFENEIGYESNKTLQEFKDKIESTKQTMENMLKEPIDDDVQAIINELRRLSALADLLLQLV